MKTAPCKDCEERHLGCHSECKRYLEYLNEHKEIMAAEKLRRKNTYYSKEELKWMRNW